MLRVASRPISPVWIYSWLITNTLSIVHRATGLVMSVGLLVLVCWLAAIAGGATTYAHTQAVFGAVWFKVPLAIWAYCFFYHFANGIRHLLFDAGFGFERSQIRRSGWTVVGAASVLATVYLICVIV